MPRQIAERNSMYDAEANPEFSAAILRWMHELAPSGVFTTDVDLNIRGWNRWLQIYSGRTASEVVGRNLLEVYPEIAERHLNLYYEDSLKGQVRLLSQKFHRYLLPMPSITPGGYSEYMQQRAYISPLIHDGRVIGTITVIHDVTERVGREIELQGQIEKYAELLISEQAARRSAEENSRLKDEFLATVSHELRTPLNAILGWSHLLQLGTLDAESSQQALKTIERNVHAQNKLIEDLLDVSRIISGKLRLNIRQVDMQAVISSAVSALEPTVQNKGVRLATEIDPLAGSVSGDADRLQQVVWNLLSNAVKFTGKGGTVLIQLRRADSHLEVVVSDTGIGIKNEFLPFIFDRFRQAESSSTRAYKGLGLGLAIVRHLVEIHGGTVRADSAGEGQGATFTVSLPTLAIQEPRVTASHERPARETRRFDSPVLRNLKVLVVDDEPDSRDLIATILTQCGALLLKAASAREGLEVLDREPVDVIIGDIEMPGEDGYSFIRNVRAREASGTRWIPAAALTAYSRTEDRRLALAEGYQIHIPKPVEPAELVEVVANLADLAVKRRSLP